MAAGPELGEGQSGADPSASKSCLCNDLIGSVALLATCGSDSTLEPIGTIPFTANDSVPIDLFDPPASDNAGSLVEWEEVQLLAADRLAVIFTAGEASCEDPCQHKSSRPSRLFASAFVRNAECVGPGTFQAVHVILEAPLGDRTVLNELCHGEETTQPCGPVDELSGARLNREGYVSYLDP